MEQFKTVVLAAGEGKRMHSNLPKALHKILDQPMIQYITDAVKAAGGDEICIVIGHQGEMLSEALGQKSFQFVRQDKQLGTGHAVMCAKDFIGHSGTVLVLYGDTPLVSGNTLKDFIHRHITDQNACTFISTIVGDSTGYGRVIKDNQGKFQSIVEHKDADSEQQKICEINTGIYCFDAAMLNNALAELKNDNAQGEYYLTDVLSILIDKGQRVDVACFQDCLEFEGVNNRVQLADAAQIMKQRINRIHMENGVSILDPSQTYIGPRVTIGQDTTIYPGTILEGDTSIGCGCIIGPQNRIVNTKVGDGCQVLNSMITDAEIGNNAQVGPFAYIRPNSSIGNNTRIGDFVEIKNSVIGDGTKVSHLTYVGDCDAGKNINFGCGTVTVNYDGKKKYRTTIEDNAFIGCNTNLVAPVTVKSGAYTAAGSTITEEVPANSLAIARCRQTNKLNWKK